MRSFLNLLLLAVSFFAIGANAGKCNICGDDSEIGAPDTILFELEGTVCTFVAIGSNGELPFTICPIIADFLNEFKTVTCKDLQDIGDDGDLDAVCPLLPAFVNDSCECSRTAEEETVISFFRFLLDLFRQLLAI